MLQISSFADHDFLLADSYGNVLMLVAIVIFAGGIIALWSISKKSSKWTVLVLAVGIFFLGKALSDIRTRELLTLSGALTLLGVAGGLLGIFDYLRKRNN